MLESRTCLWAGGTRRPQGAVLLCDSPDSGTLTPKSPPMDWAGLEKWGERTRSRARARGGEH